MLDQEEEVTSFARDPEPGLDAMEDDSLQGDETGKEINITDDGGVSKKILVAGNGWEKPEKGDKVTVHYVGTLEDGTKFDSSRDRDDAFEFTLGEGRVIRGWDLGVATMKKGEKSILKCTAPYAYGDSGSPPKIPPGATLNFEVELLGWQSAKDISGDGGVIKTVVAEGNGWQKPGDRDEVLVSYSAKVQGSSEPFASSPEGGVEFTLGDGLPGLSGVGVAVKTMKKGETVHLILKPEYALGEAGNSSVPANSTVEVDLKLLSWKRVEDVTTDGLVVKKTLVDSEEWKKPNEGAKVTARVVGKLQDGTVFDDYPATKELKFTTDEEMVPEGLDQAIQKMKQGEKALVTVAPEYGYGATGRPAGPEGSCQVAAVPGNATLTYEVELVEFENARESWDMKDHEKVEAAAAKKEKGNKAYKEGKTQRAVSIYDKALNFISYDKDFVDDAKTKAKELRKTIQLNLAAAHLKLKNFKEAAAQAGKVLEVDPYNPKALFRHAEALIGSGDLVEAEQDIKKGLTEHPDHADLAALHRKLKAIMKEVAKKEQALYSKMFKFPASNKKPAATAAPAADATADATAQGDQGAAVAANADQAAPMETSA